MLAGFLSVVVATALLLLFLVAAWGRATERRGAGARRRSLLFIGVLLGTLMIPAAVTMVPLFVLFRELQWVDSFRPLIIFPLFGGAYAIFFLRQFLAPFPPIRMKQPVWRGARTGRRSGRSGFPVMTVNLLDQRYVVEGLALSGSKG